MRGAAGIHLLCVSLVASSVADWHASDPPPPLSGVQAPSSSSSQPGDEQDTVSNGSSSERNLVLRQKEGRAFAVVRSKLVDRITQPARANLRSRSASDLPPLLWIHTCSVSLPLRHVRLQV